MIGALLILTLTPAQTPPLSDIGAEKLNAMCSASGGLAGPFSEDTIEADPIAVNEWSTKTWALDPAVGPFETFERWAQPYGTIINTLRYEGATSDELNSSTLASHIQSIAKPAGWTLFTHKDPLIQAEAGYRFFKDVTVDGKETRLWLLADGGSETTSLYCQREDLMSMSLIKRWERYVAYRRDAQARGTSE